MKLRCVWFWLSGLSSVGMGSSQPRTLELYTETEVVSKDDPVAGWLRYGDSGQGHHVEVTRRGSSSYGFKQRQYNVDFVQASGGSLAVPFLGMPAHDKWVFHGPYVDRSLIRNALVYALGRELGVQTGDDWFAPRAEFFELLVNGSYEGVYLGVEKITPGPKRLPWPSELTKNLGHPTSFPFVIKLQSKQGLEATSLGSRFDWVWPTAKKLTKMSDPVLAEHMKQHMKATLNHMEASLKQAPESYGRFVTASSLVDYVLVGEVFKNIDHYRRSVFMRHMGDGTFKMGPLWDFNLAADNLWVYGQHSVQGFNILGSHYIDGNRPAFWFKDVFEVPAFRSAVKSRYLALRQPGQLLHTEVLLGKILSFRMYLQEAGVRHGKKWNPILHPVHGFVFHAPQWEQNVEDSITKLSYWLKNRLEWLDAHL